MTDFRVIPGIDALRQRPAVRDLEAQYGELAVVDALRAAAASLREAMARGETTAGGDTAWAAERIEALARSRIDRLFAPSLAPVVNATGVVVHTNLGRAPLAAAALQQVAAVSRGYSTLEYDLQRGARGRRDVHAEILLRRLTGAESAVIVNNNAAAVLLMLSAVARGREVVVSRGELVEIGGGFRVPDVMAQSGATLREVGTTNRTRAADYAAAISERTALILRVHPSNFRIEGFTERPALEELAAIGRRFGVPVAEDLGSGLLAAGPEHPLAGVEPTVRGTVAAGADLCCFSGDKLLGGPQSGIILGRATLVDAIRRHPLMRALRAGKMTYAALEATLIEYAAGRAHETVPIQRMLLVSAAAVRGRAERLMARVNALDGWRATLIEGTSAVGGGSAPGVELPTWLVAIEKHALSADALEARLRALAPPVIARIERDRLLLDLRTVMPDEDEQLPALFEQL